MPDAFWILTLFTLVYSALDLINHQNRENMTTMSPIGPNKEIVI